MSEQPIPSAPVITAHITGHSADLRIGDTSNHYTAVDTGALQQTLMSRVLAVAGQFGQPVKMTVVDERVRTVLEVAPDGSVEVLHEAPATEPSPSPGATVSPRAQVEPRRLGAASGPPPGYVPPQPVHPAGTPVGSPAPGAHRGQRPSFITVGRTVQPADRGWRGNLNRLGLRMSPGKEEQAYRADVAAVARHWPGTRTVAVANPKGSASKTPTAVCLASVFAREGGAGVLAWDNNETEGTMRFRTEWSPHQADLLQLLPKVEQLLAPMAGVAEMAGFVHHQPADKYDVLWSDTTIDSDHIASAEDVEQVHRVASRYYRMVLMDSGNSNRAPNWRAMISKADALVVPCTNVEDTAEVGARLLETLTNRDEHSAALARNALVVVSQRTKHSQNMDRISRDFEGLARRVVQIPYDPALETGVIRFGALHPETQRAWLSAAAALTETL